MSSRASTRDVEAASSARVGVPLVFGVLVALLVVGVVYSAGKGQLPISPGEVLGSIARKLGVDWGPDMSHRNGDVTLWNVRFPRIAMALLVGASLGVAGAVMQGVFGNPLAEPSVIGVSSGAAVGACAAIVWKITWFGTFTTPILAFVASVITTVAVYAMSRRDGRAEVVTIVLMGIAVNALTSGLVGWFVFMGDTSAREQIVFWQLGSLNGSRWQHVWAVLPLMAVGLIGSILIARRLDLLALGERSARHLGVNVERLRLVAIVLASLLVGPAVAFSGIIGFVGLIVAHLIRMLIGPSHPRLIPAAALGGATVLLLADVIARTAKDYADLPIGMLTAVVGGPTFFLLIRKTRKQAGGWA